VGAKMKYQVVYVGHPILINQVITEYLDYLDACDMACQLHAENNLAEAGKRFSRRRELNGSYCIVEPVTGK